MLHRNFISFFFVFPLSLVFLFSTAKADTVQIANFDDTFITGNTILGNNDDNHASDIVFSAYRNSFLWGDTLIKPTDVFGTGPNQLSADDVIQSAKLHVWLDISWGNATNTYRLYELETDWNATTVTSNNFGRVVDNSDGIAIDSLAGPTDSVYSTDTEYVFDVTASLLAWQSGTSNFGWGLTASSARNEFFSSESSASGRRPSLVVNFTAIPEPGVATTIAIGMLCFLAKRRRQFT